MHVLTQWQKVEKSLLSRKVQFFTSFQNSVIYRIEMSTKHNTLNFVKIRGPSFSQNLEKNFILTSYHHKENKVTQ